MHEIIGYLILCPLAFLIGYVCCWDRIAEQEKRERPLQDALFHYQIDEAYRAGQKNPEPGMYFDAPAPDIADRTFTPSFAPSCRCTIEPLFPDAEKFQEQLRRNRKIKGSRINGIWRRG